MVPNDWNNGKEYEELEKIARYLKRKGIIWKGEGQNDSSSARSTRVCKL